MTEADKLNDLIEQLTARVAELSDPVNMLNSARFFDYLLNQVERSVREADLIAQAPDLLTENEELMKAINNHCGKCRSYSYPTPNCHFCHLRKYT
jgi:hypothetical protein